MFSIQLGNVRLTFSEEVRLKIISSPLTCSSLMCFTYDLHVYA